MRKFRTSKSLVAGLAFLALFGLVIPEATRTGMSHTAVSILGLLAAFEIVAYLSKLPQRIRVLIPTLASIALSIIVFLLKGFVSQDNTICLVLCHIIIFLEVALFGSAAWIIHSELWEFPNRMKAFVVWMSISLSVAAFVFHWNFVFILFSSFFIYFWAIRWILLRNILPHKLALLILFGIVFSLLPLLTKDIGSNLLIPDYLRKSTEFWAGNLAISILDASRVSIRIFAVYLVVFGIWHWTVELLFGIGRVRAKLLGSYLLTAIGPLVLFACIFGFAAYLFTVTYRSTMTRKLLATEQRNFEKWVTSLTIRKQFWDRIGSEVNAEKHLPLSMLDLYPDALFDVLRKHDILGDSVAVFTRIGGKEDTVKIPFGYQNGGVFLSVYDGDLCMFSILQTKDYLLRAWVPVTAEFLRKVKTLCGTDITFNPVYQLNFDDEGMNISLSDTTVRDRRKVLESSDRMFNEGKNISTIEKPDANTLGEINLMAGGNVLNGVDWKTGEKIIFPYALSLTPKMFYEDVFKPTDNESLNRGIVGVFLLLCAGFVLMMIVISWIGWKVAGGINKSVRSLEKGVQELRSGHLLYEMPVQGGAEFRQVAESFNMLTRDIRRMLRELVDKERIEGELSVARSIQQALLPTSLPKLDKIQLAARSIPAKEVGGDYYDIIDLGEGKFLIALGDVSGKGVASAMVMTKTQSFLRALSGAQVDLVNLMTGLNKALCLGSHPGMFVSLFIGLLDSKEKTIEYINGGHDFPIIFSTTTTDYLYHGGMILGVMPDAEYVKNKISVSAGSKLFIYTDGISETKDHNDEEFGIMRIESLLYTLNNHSAENIINSIFERVHEHSAGMPAEDDRTVMVLVFE